MTSDSKNPADAGESTAVHSTTTRARMLRRFESWLDETLLDEAFPAGVPEEILAEIEADSESRPVDLYSLWAAMTTLAQEVKLQGRTFKQLEDVVRTVARDPDSRADKDTVEILIDLRDRLQRGLASSHMYTERAQTRLAKKSANGLPKRRKWKKLVKRQRRAAADSIEGAKALARGTALSVERIDEALERLEVSEIPCEGHTFDANRMNAVDIEETFRSPEGAVLEVYRSGYEWKGRVFRPAEVKVARQPNAERPDAERND